MTKEELEEYGNKIVMQEKSKLQKEAENYLNQNCERWESDSLCADDIAIENYLAGSEPREKQIQIDAEQIRALQKQNGELTDELTKKSDTNHQLVEQMAELNERCSELEAQIEKMKCLNEEIIKALNECLDYEWLHAHNGKAKYLYLQTVIDIVNEKFEEIKEK